MHFLHVALAYKQDAAVKRIEDLLEALDEACLGRTAIQSLRRAGNSGRPLKGVTNPGYYVSTHVTADLCNMADVIEKFRADRTEDD